MVKNGFDIPMLNASFTSLCRIHILSCCIKGIKTKCPLVMH